MTTIVGLSGSLRKGSYNSALLRAAAAAMPAGSTMRIEPIDAIPLYDGDVESAHGLPARVAELKDAIAAAEGLLICTPEYNNGIPGVLKNAIDWLSRPASDLPRVFGGKPVALAGASPGGFGTLLAQAAWLPVLRALGADAWPGGRMVVARAGSVFGPDGAIVDARTADALRAFVEGFVAHAASRGARGG